MKIGIIGAGIAGTTVIRTLRSLDSDVDITIFGEEPIGFYPRPKLPEVLAGRISPPEEIYQFKKEWFEKRKIHFFPETKVIKVDPEEKVVVTDKQGDFSFDKLIFATGARNFVPPGILGLDKKGVFLFRNLEHVTNILKNLKPQMSEVSVIGGGFLGLEAARAFVNQNCARTNVVELSNWLLFRQLDEELGKLLTKKFEKMGIQVYTGTSLTEIQGEGKVENIILKDGRKIPSDIVVISTGIVSNKELAKDAGLEVKRGIVVNEYMGTSTSDILAVGDCAEYQGMVWGNIPTALEQAKAAAKNILNSKSVSYKPVVPIMKLKVRDIIVTCVGNSRPRIPCDCVKIESEKGIAKYQVKEDKLIGAAFIDFPTNELAVKRLIEKDISIPNLAIKIKEASGNVVENF